MRSCCEKKPLFLIKNKKSENKLKKTCENCKEVVSLKCPKGLTLKLNIMTLTQVTKQIEKLETKVSKLSRELNRTMKTETEKELNKQREILFHLEKIQGLLS